METKQADNENKVANIEGILLEPNVIAHIAAIYPNSIIIHNLLEDDKAVISTPAGWNNIFWAFQSSRAENTIYGDYIWMTDKDRKRIDIKTSVAYDFSTVSNAFLLKPGASKKEWSNNWKRFLGSLKLNAYISAMIKNPEKDLLGKYVVQPVEQKYFYFSFNTVKTFVEEVMLSECIPEEYVKAIETTTKFKTETNKQTGEKETVKYESQYLKLRYVYLWYTKLPEERKKRFYRGRT